jgi:hypothetical protein
VLRESQLKEDISLLLANSSKAAIVAIAEVVDKATEELFSSSFAIDLNSIA